MYHREAMESSDIGHAGIRQWVAGIAATCQPDTVYFCDGSDAEHRRLCAELVEAGTFTRLNEDKRPGSFLARSDNFKPSGLPVNIETGPSGSFTGVVFNPEQDDSNKEPHKVSNNIRPTLVNLQIQ